MAGGQVQADHLKLVFCIVSAFPAAVVHRCLPNAFIKHWMTILFTSFLMLKVLNASRGFAHIIGTSLFSYIFTKYYRGSRGPWINFALIMISLAACHLERQFSGVQGDTKLDYSGALMVVIMKLSSFGFNVRDGRVDVSVLSSHQARMKVDAYPSLLAFYGWILFFPGFLVGPPCEFMDYMRLVTLPLHETSPEPLKSEQRSTRLVPWRPLLAMLAKVTVFLVGLVYIHPTYNFDAMVAYPYLGYSPLKRFLFVQVTGVLTRFRFYVVWLLSEGPCMISGISFNGFDKTTNRPLWNRVTPVSVSVEWSPNIQVTVSRWNMFANRWLKNYVFVRVLPIVGKSKAGLITYSVSAVWHGFLPGYYIYFLTMGFLQFVGLMWRKTVRPLFLTADTQEPLPVWKTAYDVMCIFVTMSFTNTLSACFMLLNWDKNIIVLKSFYFYPYIISFGGLFFWVLFKKPLIRMQKRRVAAAAAKNEKIKDDAAQKVIETDLAVAAPSPTKSTAIRRKKMVEAAS
ncbi:MBOAT, membrane-bound O-acyltransferase family-domain-containing protein [Gongronella butleri]|nr:MBOAT, membrane-bound O-acyltransferase family-domain-containing protein [Gongronella butleri]